MSSVRRGGDEQARDVGNDLSNAVGLLARVGKLVGCDGAGWLRDRAALAGLPAGDEGTVASIELLWQEIAAGGEARSGEPGDIGQS